jgi:hypothetical protein
MRNTKYINTDTVTFLVHIKMKSNNNVFICEMFELGEILKEHNNSRGNVDIKMFSNINFRFQRITKANLKRLFSWETETTEELKKINLI